MKYQRIGCIRYRFEYRIIHLALLQDNPSLLTYVEHKNSKAGIYLFEPVREYSDFSKKFLPSSSKLIFINKGLSDKNGQATIYKNQNLNNIGWNSFLRINSPLDLIRSFP